MPLTIDATTTAFITLPDVLRQANVPASANSGDLAELDLMREAAQDVVEGIVGPVLWRTVTELVPVNEATYAYLSGGMAVLSTKPVVSVTSATVIGTPAVVTYTLDSQAGLLTHIQPWTWTYARDLSVTYIAGRSICPSAIRLAGLIIATHLWQTQTGNAPSAGGAFGQTEQRLDVAEFYAGYSVPNRAVELLTPYRIPQQMVG